MIQKKIRNPIGNPDFYRLAESSADVASEITLLPEPQRPLLPSLSYDG